jgi:hypothetical protein
MVGERQLELHGIIDFTIMMTDKDNHVRTWTPHQEGAGDHRTSAHVEKVGSRRRLSKSFHIGLSLMK